MANFDAMVPMIPKDTRVPVDHAREQMKVNKVEKIQEIRTNNEEDSATIENDKQREGSREQQQQQQQQHQSSAPAASDEISDDETPSSGHIDTYA